MRPGPIFAGKLIIISRHPNSGKSEITRELTQIFQLYKSKHNNQHVWIFTDTGDVKTATRTLLHFTNDTYWKKDQIDYQGLIQSYENIKMNYGSKAITVIEGHRMFFCKDLIPKCHLQSGFTLHIRPEGKEAKGSLMQNGTKRSHVKLNTIREFSHSLSRIIAKFCVVWTQQNITPS